jgi:hypothetical protein
MPGLNEKVRVLAITDHSPSRFQHQLELIGTKEYVCGIAGYAIHGCAERMRRAKRIHRVTGIDLNGLSGKNGDYREYSCQYPNRARGIR